MRLNRAPIHIRVYGVQEGLDATYRACGNRRTLLPSLGGVAVHCVSATTSFWAAAAPLPASPVAPPGLFSIERAKRTFTVC